MLLVTRISSPLELFLDKQFTMQNSTKIRLLIILPCSSQRHQYSQKPNWIGRKGSRKTNLLTSPIKMPKDWFAFTDMLRNCFDSSCVASFFEKKSSFSRSKYTSNTSVSQLSITCIWIAFSNGLKTVDTAFAVGVWRSIIIISTIHRVISVPFSCWTVSASSVMLASKHWVTVAIQRSSCQCLANARNR